MNNEPQIKFSVIIPAYNASATIARAVDSCLKQTLAPYEIIIVDDASTDDTETILSTYNTIQYIKLIQNCGSSVARNKGMDIASGDYIAFLDADDIWHKDKLALLNMVLLARPEINFLYHTYTLNDISTIKLPESGTVYRIPFVKLLNKNTIATPCAIVKTSIAEPFKDSMRYMEDYDLWLRLAYKYKVFYIDMQLTQLGRPVLSKGGVSENKWAMRRGEQRAYRRLVRLNPLFLFLLPLLYTLSFGKHIYKMFSR
ncbi:MAG: glycosyltransferase family A protein [Flavipsychrobacter sp.]